jgi:hypothetical protein
MGTRLSPTSAAYRVEARVVVCGIRQSQPEGTDLKVATTTLQTTQLIVGLVDVNTNVDANRTVTMAVTVAVDMAVPVTVTVTMTVTTTTTVATTVTVTVTVTTTLASPRLTWFGRTGT